MLGHLHMCHGQKVDKLFVLRDDHQVIFIAVIASHTSNINGHFRNLNWRYLIYKAYF